MGNNIDPYRSPSEAEAGGSSFESFEGWTNSRLLALFFLPSTLFAGFIGVAWWYRHFRDQTIPEHLGFLALFLIVTSMIAVSLFTAYLNKLRQQSGWGSMVLVSVIYFIAEIFSIFLAFAVVWILASLTS